jgi:TusA-related sulfurtransferase
MPELDGFEVLRWLAEQPHYRSLPVVVLTSSGLESDMRLALQLGARGFYIQKGKSVHRAAHAVLDIRGVACPGPIVEAKKLLNGMQIGEVLRLISNCPGISADITGWAKATGMKLVETFETAPGEYEFYIRKT